MIISIIFIIWIIITFICGTLFFKERNRLIRRSSKAGNCAVSVIIPARNEADNLPVLLESIKKQKNVRTEVIVADDGSTDRTAEIAEKLGAKVVEVPETDLPGKYFACFTGSRHAASHLLLFMDADTFFTDEHSLADLCHHYGGRPEKGLVSVQPFHETGKKHETFSAVFNLMTVAGINIFSVFKNRYEAGTVFGPVMLTDKDDYHKTGGHMAAKGAIIEGKGIYEAYRAQDIPIHHLLGKNTVHVRMYSGGFRSMVDGWKKHISIGSENTGAAVMASIMIWLSSGLVFPVFLLYAIIFDTYLLAPALFLYLLGCIQFHQLCRPVINVGRAGSAFYPLYQYFFFFVYTLSLYQTRIKKTVEWKDRNIEYKK